MRAARKARIRIHGTNPRDVETVAKEIVEVARKAGIRVSGPVPLPTKRLMIVVRRAPSGQGYHTFDHWELRIHKRLIDLEADEKIIRRLLSIRVPESVKIELELL